MAEPREAPFGHESPGVATRKVIGVVLTLGTAVAIALVLLWLALTHWVMPEHAQLKTQPAVLPPAPRLQPHPDNDLTSLREEKRALLQRYVWTDKSHRFARIPIQRAMQMYAREQKQKPGSGTRKPGPAAGTPAASASTSGPGIGDRRGGAAAASASSGGRR
jgi:hypothetical protein